MSEPYTDDEKSMARVLGVNVQTVRVSKYAQHLDRVFRRKNVVADVKVGKIFSGPNSEPKVEVSFSTDAAVHLSSILDDEDKTEDDIQYRNDHNQMIDSLREISEVFENYGAVVDNGVTGEMVMKIRKIMLKNGYLDGE